MQTATPTLSAVAAAVALGLFYDSETTGLPEWGMPSEDPCQPHIVGLCAKLVNLETREVVKEFDVLVKPDGWTWDDSATSEDAAFKAHGITVARATAEGIPEKDATQMLLDMVAMGEQLGAVTLIGHNESFDRRMVRIALKRYFDRALAEGEADPGDQPSDKWKNQVAYCTCWQAHKFTKLPKNKKPKLVEAFQHFTGRAMEGAHSAGGDVDGCMTVYWAIQDLLNPPAAVAPELQAA